MNGPEIAVGNHTLPSRVERIALPPAPEETMLDRGPRLRSMVLMGLYPRKAEKSADVGGIFVSTGMRIGAPEDVRDDENADGRFFVRSNITMVKKIPMLSVWPVFCMVALIPEATPLKCGGTAFITAVTLGAILSALRGKKVVYEDLGSEETGIEKPESAPITESKGYPEETASK